MSPRKETSCSRYWLHPFWSSLYCRKPSSAHETLYCILHCLIVNLFFIFFVCLIAPCIQYLWWFKDLIINCFTKFLFFQCEEHKYSKGIVGNQRSVISWIPKILDCVETKLKCQNYQKFGMEGVSYYSSLFIMLAILKCNVFFSSLQIFMSFWQQLMLSMTLWYGLQPGTFLYSLVLKFLFFFENIIYYITLAVILYNRGREHILRSL